MIGIAFGPVVGRLDNVMAQSWSECSVECKKVALENFQTTSTLRYPVQISGYVTRKATSSIGPYSRSEYAS